MQHSNILISLAFLLRRMLSVEGGMNNRGRVGCKISGRIKWSSPQEGKQKKRNERKEKRGGNTEGGTRNEKGSSQYVGPYVSLWIPTVPLKCY